MASICYQHIKGYKLAFIKFNFKYIVEYMIIMQSADQIIRMQLDNKNS